MHEATETLSEHQMVHFIKILISGEWFTWGKDSSVIPVEEGQIGMVHKIKKMEGVDKITVTSSGNCFFFVAIPKILVRRIQRFADLVFITVE